MPEDFLAHKRLSGSVALSGIRPEFVHPGCTNVELPFGSARRLSGKRGHAAFRLCNLVARAFRANDAVPGRLILPAWLGGGVRVTWEKDGRHFDWVSRVASDPTMSECRRHCPGRSDGTDSLTGPPTPAFPTYS